MRGGGWWSQGAHEEYEKGNESKLVYSWRAYLYSLDWILVALKKPERELLQHAGLDMVVYLRMFKLGSVHGSAAACARDEHY